MKKLAPMLLVLMLFFANVSFVSAQDVVGESPEVTNSGAENQNLPEQVRQKRSFWVRVAEHVVIEIGVALFTPEVAHSD